MGAAAYREAPVSSSPPTRRPNVRAQRRRYFAAVAAAVLGSFGVLVSAGNALTLLVFFLALVYAVALVCASSGWQGRYIVVVVGFLVYVASLSVGNASVRLLANDDWAVAAGITTAGLAVISASVGYLRGRLLRLASAIVWEAPMVAVARQLPVVERAAPTPRRPPPPPRPAPPPRAVEPDVPLEEVPESMRELVFAVRLRRRLHHNIIDRGRDIATLIVR